MGSTSELINVLGDVKARVQDKLGIVDFPLPQFILIGKQSVGKSRLTEALAGETYNFISGTLGSRRPTVLEFRNVASCKTSRWYMRDRETNQWTEHPVDAVMKLVGDAHEELGEDTSAEPVYVRLESANSVDMQVVDLPGFRDFARDEGKQKLANKITKLVRSFMVDQRNVMLCVEQANDAANMSTLSKCREFDPSLERTILIRSKLDKYYDDLTNENVHRWVEGFGDLPERFVSFALTLPWWQDGMPPPKPFEVMRREANTRDILTLGMKGLNAKRMQKIGFEHFQGFMEGKTAQMFAAALGPVTTRLVELKAQTKKREQELQTELRETDPNRILGVTRECGASFASALSHVMEGVLRPTHGRMTLETELREFHAYHEALGSDHFDMLPAEGFCSLDDYIDYLRNDFEVGAFDAEVNGGAQFRRLLTEVEVFLRFSEISTETNKRDLIQARGAATTALAWRDSIVKFLCDEAYQPFLRRVQYVGERIKWFFEVQKDVIIEFMDRLDGAPTANLYSPLYTKHVKLIQGNRMIKHMVFQTYDIACQRQLQFFVALFDNTLTSTFSNPWVFLKGEAEQAEIGDLGLAGAQEWIPSEIDGVSKVESAISRWLQDNPAQEAETDVEKLKILLLKTYGYVRSQACDKVELFAESFFKIPMLHRLEEAMSMVELSDTDKSNHESHCESLTAEISKMKNSLVEINGCIDRLHGFKLACETTSV